MKRSSHHWHVLLDDKGRALPAATEHEHLVNTGRRHAHYREHTVLLEELLGMGMPVNEARAMALRLDRTAYTTYDFDRQPQMAPGLEGPGLERTLHPEVRRSLS